MRPPQLAGPTAALILARCDRAAVRGMRGGARPVGRRLWLAAAGRPGGPVPARSAAQASDSSPTLVRVAPRIPLPTRARAGEREQPAATRATTR